MSGAGSVPHTPGALRPEEIMTDEDFVKAIEAMGGESDDDIGELLKVMNESRIISWEEAERILNDTRNAPIKSSLPEQTRPTEPDNDTDVDQCIQKLLDNDSALKEINLNNMKRTPIPQIRRLIEAMAYNEHCERLSLANMGLYDNDIAALITVIEMNTALKKLNLETNYLSGDFFAKLFKAALVNQTLEEIKAVNQGVSFATTAEKEIIDSIVANTGLTKISINLRLPEGRHKVENATLRNGEYKRILRREAAMKAKWEAEELAKNPVPHLPKEPKTEPKKPVSAAKPAKVRSDSRKPLAPKKDEPATVATEEKRPASRVSSLARKMSDVDQSPTPVIKLGGDGEVTPKKAPSAPAKKPTPSSTEKKVLEGSKTDRIPSKALLDRKPPQKSKFLAMRSRFLQDEPATIRPETPKKKPAPTPVEPTKPTNEINGVLITAKKLVSEEAKKPSETKTTKETEKAAETKTATTQEKKKPPAKKGVRKNPVPDAKKKSGSDLPEAKAENELSPDTEEEKNSKTPPKKSSPAPAKKPKLPAGNKVTDTGKKVAGKQSKPAPGKKSGQDASKQTTNQDSDYVDHRLWTEELSREQFFIRDTIEREEGKKVPIDTPMAVYKLRRGKEVEKKVMA
ncbi:hypothetical protein NECAME_07649 [Necator americanus]|uniref:Tropomodulin n=1 Tax=Necator americanus TaxID=51031 RepID=W2TLG3_NECAM|nr:hypothetical protein NECAME_07649 [Necator americanus]ETN82935.1 hypothetical protein NECAME_07649 [Necator americanus]